MISATCLRQVSVDAVNRNRYGDRQWPACDVIVPLDGRLAARVFRRGDRTVGGQGEFIAAVVGDRPGKGVEHHIEPEFEPVGEVLLGVTPDQQRNATRQLSMTSRQPGRGHFLPRPYPTWSVVLGFD